MRPARPQSMEKPVLAIRRLTVALAISGGLWLGVFALLEAIAR